MQQTKNYISWKYYGHAQLNKPGLRDRLIIENISLEGMFFFHKKIDAMFFL